MCWHHFALSSRFSCNVNTFCILQFPFESSYTLRSHSPHNKQMNIQNDFNSWRFVRLSLACASFRFACQPHPLVWYNMHRLQRSRLAERNSVHKKNPKKIIANSQRRAGSGFVWPFFFLCALHSVLLDSVGSVVDSSVATLESFKS